MEKFDWEGKKYYSLLPEELKKDIKTIRQWAKEGMYPAFENAGEDLYSNRFCTGVYHYLHISEVRKGTPEEIDEILGPERERRKAQREREKELVRTAIQRLESSEWYREVEVLNLYAGVCKQFIKREEAAEVKHSQGIVIDTETTGLDWSCDEILQLSIIDEESGEKLFDEYFKPFMHTTWYSAQKINNISPKMVADKPYLFEKAAEIQQIISSADKIIGYNTEFDISFLKNMGFKFENNQEIIDVMREFAPIYGEYVDYLGDYKWQKLIACAYYYGYDWESEGAAHNSLNDCYATLHCYKKMHEA